MLIHQQRIGPMWIIDPMSRIERRSNFIHPELRSLLCLVIYGNIDGIQVNNFLKANNDNVGSELIVRAPVGAEPGF